jgi:HEPN domain-containing protein
MMGKQEKFDFWIKQVQYDIDKATAMLAAGRWLYVAFICQWAVPKVAKAFYSLYLDNIPPRTHEISTIIREYENRFSTPVSQDEFDFFDELTSYYTNTRYKSYKDEINSSLNKEKCESLLKNPKRFLHGS